jgi:alkanesulfonate monooxygenase SsuD/methylene tetrahydromethanopterin reductase-like flavin-dependent oxidoreductase (luciferase family)
MTNDAARTGVALRDPLPWRDFLLIAETAEGTGYETVLVPEIAGREAFATQAALAVLTTEVRLGTGVVTVVSRRAFTTAMAAVTVQELSGERFILGLGAGRARPRPLDLVRAYVRQIRNAWEGRPVVDEAGREARLTLDQRAVPPLWLGALGDGMIRLAGEVADGVLLNWCTPERVAEAKELVGESALRAGRDPAAVTIAVYVRACLGHEEDVAVAALSEAAAQYLAIPTYRRQFEAMGLDKAPGEGLVRAVCLVGSAAEADARLDAYREAGADLPVVYPVPALEPASSIMGTVLAAAPSPALEA